MTNGVQQDLIGPPVQENWRAFLRGSRLQGAFEHPLFTDARVVGEVDEGLGPYQLLLTFNMGADLTKPSAVLRTEYYTEKTRQVQVLPVRTEASGYHGGDLSDELCALVGLVLGIRLRAGAISRYFDPERDPRGHPWPGHRSDPVLHRRRPPEVILPNMAQRRVNLGDAARSRLLKALPSLSAEDALALVKAARLRQDAVWIAESEPELAWLLLVSAAETAASHWHSERATPSERLEADKPQVAALLREHGGAPLLEKVAATLADSIGATKKFVDFLIQFLPPPPDARPPQAG